MAERDTRALADVIDSVRWDYDPEAEEVSPLVSTEQYFRDFPWEGDGESESESHIEAGTSE